MIILYLHCKINILIKELAKELRISRPILNKVVVDAGRNVAVVDLSASANA